MVGRWWKNLALSIAVVVVAIGAFPLSTRTTQAQAVEPPPAQDRTSTVTVVLDPATTVDETGADGTVTRVMRSGPVSQVQPFTFIWFSWNAPGGAADVLLDVRTGSDPASFGAWTRLTLSDDQAPQLDPLLWSTYPLAVPRAASFEVRVSSRRSADGQFPQPGNLTATLFESAAAAIAPVPDLIEPRLPGRSNARPPIVSREAWGNPDGQQSPRVPDGWTSYHPTTHIIIHHTATDETDSNGSTVGMLRAIWGYHANTLRWGDIGYNYLIDRDGVIYEGRAGGDNVTGFHDVANEGSMGVALIGTYSGQPPSAAAQQALVNLIAWKVEQRGINPTGSAVYLGCADYSTCVAVNPGAVMPTIAAHRDVARSTSCPGDAFYALMSGIRQRVAQRLGVQPTEQLTVDDSSPGFLRTAANWYPRNCGNGGSSLDTYATDNVDESTNVGTWTPTLVRSGTYRVEVFIGDNCSGSQRTADARYRIVHSGGATVVSIDQQNRSGWVDLGTFEFAPGVAAVTLSDITSEPFALRRWITYDAVRWVPATEEVALLSVEFPQTTVQVGDLLEVRFTVRNTGALPVDGQAPAAAVRSAANQTAFALDGYVYNSDECFAAPSGAGYPSYAKQSGRFRVLLGGITGVRCADPATADYPWRWGIGPTLQPGETRTIVGYLRFTSSGSFTLRAGLNQEDRTVFARDVAPTTITVIADQTAPLPVMMNTLLQPQAQVLRLAPIPTNALNRLSDARHIRTTQQLGRFVWAGELLRWDATPPVPQARDNVVIQQTRVISAPVSGSYTFRLTTDDMGWLWVNGQLVTANLGLGAEQSSTGSITLAAGRHVLAVKIVERSGLAAAGYQMRLPAANRFVPVIDGVVDADLSPENRVGAYFRRVNGIVVAADSLGGARPIVQLLYGGNLWAEAPGGKVSIAALADDEYELSVRAVGTNASAESSLRLTVDQSLEFYRQYLPFTER